MRPSDFSPRNVLHRVLSGTARIFDTVPLNESLTRSISPVLIVGCGRSGNTLLRAMLVSGGEVSIPPESYVWPLIVRRFAHWRFGGWDLVTDNVIDAFENEPEFRNWQCPLDQVRKQARELPRERRSLASLIDLIYREYATAAGQTISRWGDKTPLNTLDLGLVATIFPNAQYVHIIRDPRAVAQSFVAASKASPGIRERTHEAAARRWVKSVSNAKALSRKIGRSRFYQVRYEDLVRRPGEELKRLCDFLGIGFDASMLTFHEHAGKLGDVSAHKHHSQVRRPLDPNRISSWEAEIDDFARDSVERITARMAKKLGYCF